MYVQGSVFSILLICILYRIDHRRNPRFFSTWMQFNGDKTRGFRRWGLMRLITLTYRNLSGLLYHLAILDFYLIVNSRNYAFNFVQLYFQFLWTEIWKHLCMLLWNNNWEWDAKPRKTVQRKPRSRLISMNTCIRVSMKWDVQI